MISLGDPEKHRNALEKWLNTLVCPGDADALAIVRRLIDPTQYSDPSDADLINTALARCLVPVALTHQDKYVLETLKERVEKAHKERVEKAQRGYPAALPRRGQQRSAVKGKLSGKNVSLSGCPGGREAAFRRVCAPCFTGSCVCRRNRGRSSTACSR